MLNYGLFVNLRRDYKVREGDDKLDESRRAELESEMERLFGIEKQHNKEAEEYRHKARSQLGFDDYENRTFISKAEEFQNSAKEAGDEAREIQKQLEFVDTPPEQPTIDTVQHTVSGAETEATGSQTTSTEQQELGAPADRATETKDEVVTTGESDTDLGEDKPISKPETDRPIYIGEIPNDVLVYAVEKMACGWKRIDVAKELMSQDPLPEWLRSISDMDVLSDKEKTDVDNLLSQRLRVADWKSDKFSSSRFQRHYEMALQAARSALRDRIHKLIEIEVEALEKAALDFQILYDDVQRKIDVVSEDTEQWERNTKLLMRIHRERTTNVAKPLVRLSNILNSLTAQDKKD